MDIIKFGQNTEANLIKIEEEGIEKAKEIIQAALERKDFSAFSQRERSILESNQNTGKIQFSIEKRPELSDNDELYLKIKNSEIRAGDNVPSSYERTINLDKIFADKKQTLAILKMIAAYHAQKASEETLAEITGDMTMAKAMLERRTKVARTFLTLDIKAQIGYEETSSTASDAEPPKEQAKTPTQKLAEIEERIVKQREALENAKEIFFIDFEKQILNKYPLKLNPGENNEKFLNDLKDPAIWFEFSCDISVNDNINSPIKCIQVKMGREGKYFKTYTIMSANFLNLEEQKALKTISLLEEIKRRISAIETSKKESQTAIMEMAQYKEMLAKL